MQMALVAAKKKKAKIAKLKSKEAQNASMISKRKSLIQPKKPAMVGFNIKKSEPVTPISKN
jgi:hypothetical protein